MPAKVRPTILRTYVRLDTPITEGFEMSGFEVFQDNAGNWRWHLRAGNGKIVTTSGESFASHYNAVRAARNVWATAGTAAPPTDDYSQVAPRAALVRLARRGRGCLRPLSTLR